MRSRIIGSIVYFFIMSSAQAQFHELGISSGAALYFGDLAPRFSNVSTGTPSYFASLFMNYKLGGNLSIRLSASTMMLQGDDISQKEESRRLRNLHFRNALNELSLMLNCDLSNHFYKPKSRWNTHVLGGIGVYSHNPQARLDGEWVDLQPLGTEGQGLTTQGFNFTEKYKLSGISIPLGMSIGYELSSSLVIALEYIYRFTFTDYLDDVSTGYPNLDILEAERGLEARRLSFRSNELEGVSLSPDFFGRRGSSDRLDTYATAGIKFLLRFGEAQYSEKN